MTTSRRSTGPHLSRREALLFEAGVKLGGVFHQYLGIPVSGRTARSLARAIEGAVGLQPFVRRVTVDIRPEKGGPLGRGRFAYRYLIPEMLDVTVELVDGPARVVANLQHRTDLRYPLMKVVRVHGPEPTDRPRRGIAPPATARSPRRRRRRSA
jgi:hypothetical protein